MTHINNRSHLRKATDQVVQFNMNAHETAADGPDLYCVSDHVYKFVNNYRAPGKKKVQPKELGMAPNLILELLIEKIVMDTMD